MTFPLPSSPDPSSPSRAVPEPLPSRRGWGLAWLGAVLAVVAALGVGEWMGWPMLAGPLQRGLSQQMHRTVSLQAAVEPGQASTAAPAASAARPPSAPASAQAQAQARGGFRVRFLGGVHLSAPWLTVAAPDWSAAPYLVQAQDLVLDLRYSDLWRAWHGQPLRIQGLQARQLDAHLERHADGRVSWQLGPDRRPLDPAAPALALPVVERLVVAQGRVHLQDVPGALSLQADLSVQAAAAPALGSLLQVRGQGHYRGLPLTLALTAAGALPGARAAARTDAQTGAQTGGQTGGQTAPQKGANAGASADANADAPAVPLTLSARVGRTSLTFAGSATDPVRLLGLTGRFTVQGPSLAAVGDPLRVTLPTTAAFHSRGRLARRADGWYVLIDDATVGSSQLNGAFVYYTDRAVPLLAGRLGGKRLHLADLGPAVGLAAKGLAGAPVAADARLAGEQSAGASAVVPVPAVLPAALPGLARPAGAAPARVDRRHPGKVLPDRPFDLAALRVMDADVLIDIAEADLNTPWLAPLRPLHGHLLLAGGVLTLRDLDARTAQGRLGGQVQLDGRSRLALWTADLRWDGVRLEHWVRQTRAKTSAPYVSGQLNGRAKLAGQGRSTAEILSSLQGTAHTELTGGSISHLAVEAAGLDLAQALGVLVVGDDALPVGCAVADLVADRGVFRPRVMVLDTTDSALWVEGSLSLATEALDLRAVVSPKDFSPLALRSPLHVQGSFAHPKLTLELGRLAPRVAAAALLALVNPLAALIPLLDTGDTDRAARAADSCRSLMERHPAAAVRSAAKGSAPARKAVAAATPKR